MSLMEGLEGDSRGGSRRSILCKYRCGYLDKSKGLG